MPSRALSIQRDVYHLYCVYIIGILKGAIFALNKCLYTTITIEMDYELIDSSKLLGEHASGGSTTDVLDHVNVCD